MIHQRPTTRRKKGKTRVDGIGEVNTVSASRWTDLLQEEGRRRRAGRHRADALSRRLDRLTRFDFIRDSWRGDSAKKILEYLDKGISVVLEFGRYGSALEAYILVAN